MVINGGLIDNDGVWGDDSTIVIRGQPQVGSGAVVNVEEGVTIKFDLSASLYPYDGTFNLNGTAAEPILVTSIRDDTNADTNGDGGATTPSPGDRGYRVRYS